ncbi:MAG TPA: 2'-5' RNA ligase family protein [Flavobacterium sp.]|uniref:2'-5' RNA ligase family protein n=1 Tax=Flavobacterium sp. TaxID=239 RepID=UPI002BFB96AA|nr:2'-5' RNA ligase family protein [Flavobacterium sp.]HSD15598.1 2'-5' RNA ligase family protein [Flavobacterium sp.]
MEGHYSVAIIPSEEVNALVKKMKEELAAKVGWFHSKNSAGHITINEFKAPDEVIKKVKQQLIRLCDVFEPVEVRLTGFGSYPNGAFFIDPDEDTKNNLKPIMKRINDTLIIKDLHISNDPHLTIARRLSHEKLNIAKSHFTNINGSFLCSSVVLRTFDENVKQYYVSDVFPFNSNPTEVQGTLF